MRKLIAIAGAALALAGCDELGSPALVYECVTKTQCLTTTADNVYIKRESYWLNEGRIVSVHFSLDHQPVMFVSGDDFVRYQVIGKGEK